MAEPQLGPGRVLVLGAFRYACRDTETSVWLAVVGAHVCRLANVNRRIDWCPAAEDSLETDGMA